MQCHFYNISLYNNTWPKVGCCMTSAFLLSLVLILGSPSLPSWPEVILNFASGLHYDPNDTKLRSLSSSLVSFYIALSQKIFWTKRFEHGAIYFNWKCTITLGIHQSEYNHGFYKVLLSFKCLFKSFTEWNEVIKTTGQVQFWLKLSCWLSCCCCWWGFLRFLLWWIFLLLQLHLENIQLTCQM